MTHPVIKNLAHRFWIDRLVIEQPRYPNHTALMMGINKTSTVQSAIFNYLKSLRARKLSKNYVTQSNVVLKHLLRAHKLTLTRDLAAKEVKHFLRILYRKLEPNTYAHYSRIYYHFFEFCREKKCVLYNFVQEIECDYHRTVMFFLPYQLELIFGKLPPGELRDACLLIYHTGIKTTELNKIVSTDYITHELILTERRVSVPDFIRCIVERRKFFDAVRVRGDFTDFMRQFDFEGNLRFLRNSYLLRMSLAGTPIEVIRRQIGFGGKIDVEKKIARLTNISKRFFKQIDDRPFKDYI